MGSSVSLGFQGQGCHLNVLHPWRPLLLYPSSSMLNLYRVRFYSSLLYRKFFPARCRFSSCQVCASYGIKYQERKLPLWNHLDREGTSAPSSQTHPAFLCVFPCVSLFYWIYTCGSTCTQTIFSVLKVSTVYNRTYILKLLLLTCRIFTALLIIYSIHDHVFRSCCPDSEVCSNVQFQVKNTAAQKASVNHSIKTVLFILKCTWWHLEHS